MRLCTNAAAAAVPTLEPLFPKSYPSCDETSSTSASPQLPDKASFELFTSPFLDDVAIATGADVDVDVDVDELSPVLGYLSP